MSINEENSQVKNIASTLCLLCKIESGNELIIVIGNGNEPNNHRAMESWVVKHLLNLKELSPKQQVEKLRVRLLNELESWDLNY